MKLGDVIAVSRTFTVADIDEFTRITGDRGPWHVNADASGRKMVHGLATAALSTVLGGAMCFMARRFELDFLRSVHSGDTVTCTMRVTSLAEAEHRVGDRRARATRLESTAEFVNQDGVLVAKLFARGVIPKPLAEVLADDPASRLQAKL